MIADDELHKSGGKLSPNAFPQVLANRPYFVAAKTT